jgi:hypothetical protein
MAAASEIELIVRAFCPLLQIRKGDERDIEGAEHVPRFVLQTCRLARSVNG